MISPEQQVIDASVAASASKATYAGAGTAVVGWVTSSEFGILIGVIIGVAGFAVNLYYKAREDRRREEEHRVRMEEMTGETHL